MPTILDLSCNGQTITVPAAGTPVLLASRDATSTAVFGNVGGLDVLAVDPGPADVLLLWGGASPAGQPTATKLLSGWALSLPLFSDVYAIALGAPTTVTVAIARGSA